MITMRIGEGSLGMAGRPDHVGHIDRVRVNQRVRPTFDTTAMDVLRRQQRQRRHSQGNNNGRHRTGNRRHVLASG